MSGKYWFCAIGIFLLCMEMLPASGTYPPSVPVPPSSEGSIDYDRYVKGKKIYTGKTKLQELEKPLEEVAKRLKFISEQLQKKYKQKVEVDIEGFSKTLDKEKLSLLEYYLAVRYKIKFDS